MLDDRHKLFAREHSESVQVRAAAQTSEQALQEATRAGYMSGPQRWMEFLAVPLLEGDATVWLPLREGQTYPDCERRHVVLGTPIYVAHADPAAN